MLSPEGHSHRKAVFALGVTAVALMGFLVCWATMGSVPVEAGSSDNVHGWAWSDTIGWISFNCTDESTCGTSDYGVTVDGSGILSGYAWSNNLGWISFNTADLNGMNADDHCPSGACQARFSGTNLVGWARACAGTVNGNCTGATRTDGWDGWISLDSVTAGSASPYGVTLSGGTDFQGYAWGGSVVGWIQFNPALGGVFQEPSGVSAPLTLSLAPSETLVANNQSVTLTWTDLPQGSSNYISCSASSDPAGMWSGAKAVPHSLDQGLIGHYPLDDGSGIVVTDTSGNGHNGTLMASTSATLPQWIPGVTTDSADHALSFNGTNYVDLGDTDNNIQFPLTQSIWLNTTNGSGVVTTDYGYPGDAIGNPNYSGLVISSGGGNLNIFYGNSDGPSNGCACPGGRRSWYVTGGVPLSTWALVTIVWQDALHLSAYVNGVNVLSGTSNNGGSAGVMRTTSLNHGSLGVVFKDSATSYFLNGSLDDYRLYNRALTPSEINYLYQHIPEPPPSETVGPLTVVNDAPTPYTFTITCLDKDGNSKSAQTTVFADPPTFSLRHSDDLQVLLPSGGDAGSGTTNVSAIPYFGFNKSITLTASSPDIPTATFSWVTGDNVLTAAEYASGVKLKVDASGLVAGTTYHINIDGVSGSFSVRDTITLQATRPSFQNF